MMGVVKAAKGGAVVGDIMRSFKAVKERLSNVQPSLLLDKSRILAVQLSSTINEKWRSCICAFFVGYIFLLYCLKHDHQSVELSAYGNIVVTMTSSNDSDRHIPAVDMVYTAPENGVETMISSKDSDRHDPASDMVDAAPENVVETMTSSKDHNNVYAAPGNITITMRSSADSDKHRQAADDDMQFLLPSKVREHGRKIMKKDISCNIFDGKWVYDPKSSPLYHGSQCPFLSDQVSCQRNGRPDSEYEKWRWEAKGCQIPRFNGTNMLERLRDKRVVIVGDSINRNHWESLVCLLYSAIPSSRAEIDMDVNFKSFRSTEYNCSVEFYWSPFLVQLKQNPELGRVLTLDKPSDWERSCRGADVMIFNSGHWWLHNVQRWELFQYRGKLWKDMKIRSAFLKAMKTWSRWIDHNVDKSSTKVFFRGLTALHYSKEWCYNKKQPIKDESFQFLNPIGDIVESIIGRMRTPVTYLNVSKLTQYRIDAHTSVYTIRQGKLLTRKQRRKPHSYADCSHWCLPGVPDTWNSLLYASMVMDDSSDSTFSI
ncbi:hypothetical protein I3843_03G180500 [Carya illinoinensis]|uniref:Trichome birefringence-like N-terminal domain-containing protein n=1 Tax=Carya illinoinensis TaxID=32201 RepID=A0A8T1R2H7_CARIL|nr:protein trichome birefringence-like 42 [Carya illinoinensis]KAG6661610.1 hypothetical protein CIPAW_03G186400 [Carya illinoinensis]KAG7988284.1 hypothetical protein I3843_03G180500 [Carya illinoinensis]